LALVAAVMSARRYDARSVKLVMCRLHGRFTLLFKELALRQTNEWNAEQFFPSYLKGEKTDTPRNYLIGKEKLRLIEKTGRMLKEHYQLSKAEALPVLPFAPTNGQALRFAPAPYLFQYHHHHLDGGTITSCMCFLLSGTIFETREGKPVVLKAHLLRHTFATYAVQVAQVPIDMVAEWLKQKDLEVTRYYSQVPESLVAEEHGTSVPHLALQVNVREVFLRSPQEIREQLEQAKRSVGTLIPVTGGECTLDGRCPSQFACIGCSAKLLIRPSAIRLSTYESVGRRNWRTASKKVWYSKSSASSSSSTTAKQSYWKWTPLSTIARMNAMPRPSLSNESTAPAWLA
jgi:hypothetical protein